MKNSFYFWYARTGVRARPGRKNLKKGVDKSTHLWYYNNRKGKEIPTMAKRKKTEKIGMISGIDLLKKTRGTQEISFRSGAFQTKKDKPRNKNWRKWDY